MSLVTVQYFKYPQQPHWRHDRLLRLGEDEHGVWLGARAGTVVQRGDEPPISMGQPFVQLIPVRRWWTLIVNSEGKYPIYVDVTTPARWTSDNQVEMVDLDFDVVRTGDGEVALLDEDEFEEHRSSLGYPPPLVANARTTAAELMLAVEASREPFAQVGHRWLKRLEEI